MRHISNSDIHIFYCSIRFKFSSPLLNKLKSPIYWSDEKFISLVTKIIQHNNKVHTIYNSNQEKQWTDRKSDKPSGESFIKNWSNENCEEMKSENNFLFLQSPRLLFFLFFQWNWTRPSIDQRPKGNFDNKISSSLMRKQKNQSKSEAAWMEATKSVNIACPKATLK